MLQNSKSKLGFTLIELSVVIAIIAVLDAAIGQTVKLNVVFLPAVQLPAVQLPAVQDCAVDLKIYDLSGKVVATSTETLLPNQSKSISFDNVVPGTSAAAAGDPTAVEYHASVAIPACPDNSTTCSRQERQLQAKCLEHSNEFASSLELIDDGTRKTVTALPGVSTELIGLLKGGAPRAQGE
ncbi:MAG TPA: prepilin-type N-terminal cleavage/methylation domain-containing protein [Myxococcota bacterium]|nr:prepilin-type N-terminal cleavage/methylation domain-containing protein [Myxococcota bacterium]